MRFNPIILQYFNSRRRLESLYNRLTEYILPTYGLNAYLEAQKLAEACGENYEELKRSGNYSKFFNDLRRLGICVAVVEEREELKVLPLHESITRYGKILFKISDECKYLKQLGFPKGLFKTFVSANVFVKEFIVRLIKKGNEIPKDEAKELLKSIIKEIYEPELKKRSKFDENLLADLMKIIDKTFEKKFMKLIEILSNKSIKLMDKKVLVNTEEISKLIEIKPYTFLGDFVTDLKRAFIETLKDYGLYHEWESGQPQMLPLKDVFDKGKSLKIFPEVLNFNEFVKLCEKASEVYRSIRVFVHPKYYDRPEIGYSIYMEPF